MGNQLTRIGKAEGADARTRRALSLIELTIVILIIGITAAIAAPRLSDTVRATKLRAAANQVADPRRLHPQLCDQSVPHGHFVL